MTHNNHTVAVAGCCSCMLFYSRVTNYVIFGHCAIVFQMSEHCALLCWCASQGCVHAYVWACSILLCPGFDLAHVSADPPLSYLVQKPVKAGTDLEIND